MVLTDNFSASTFISNMKQFDIINNLSYHHLNVGVVLFCSVLIVRLALMRRLILSKTCASKNYQERDGSTVISLSDVNLATIADVQQDDVGIQWCDQSSFEVLSLFCDAFIPSLFPTACTPEALHSAIVAIHPTLDKEKNNNNMVFSVDYLQQHTDYLCRGAIDMSLPMVIGKVIQRLVTKDDQFKMYILLKVLSTTIGTFLLFGWPVAFQQLPLSYRMQALEQLRDSSIPPLRVFYQTMRQLTGVLFYSYCENEQPQRDTVKNVNDATTVTNSITLPNPNWSAIQYDPISVKNDNGARDSRPCKQDHSQYLRSVINYDYVKSKIAVKDHSKSTEINDAGNNSDDIDLLEADVVIIGSGAGGGMMAHQLAKQGLNVVVLEKGGYFNKDEFQQWSEVQGLEHMYEKGGLCTTVDGNITVLAGSCVGGGSSVNWSASFRTPDWVRDDWVRQGLSQFGKDGSFDESLDVVHKLINVNSEHSYYEKEEEQHATYSVNNNNRLLWKSASALGYKPEKIPRNVKSCVNCGHCCYGCPYESKQSTITGLLEPLLIDNQQNALNNPHHPELNYQLHVIPHACVDRVLYDQWKEDNPTNSYRTKRAVGVEATVKVYHINASQSVAERLNVYNKQLFTTRRVRVNAKIIVCSAGTLHTPAVLLRSGIKHVSKGGAYKGHSLVGAFLALHPVLGAAGIFTKDVNTGLASGVSMGVVVRDPIITASNEAYRIAIQTPPVHLGFMGMLMPWFGLSTNGLSYKVSMLGWPNTACFVGISRDQSCVNNRISIDSAGQSLIKYHCIPADVELMIRGLEEMLRFMRAGGAKLLFLAHENFPFYDCSDYNSDDEQVRVHELQEFEKYLDQVRKEGVKDACMQVFSAHQMSSCRMAANPDHGPTSPSGELYECKHLYVADASVFPTSLGINPMVTVEAMSHMVSKNILKDINHSFPELATKMKAFRSLKRTSPSSHTCW